MRIHYAMRIVPFGRHRENSSHPGVLGWRATKSPKVSQSVPDCWSSPVDTFGSTAR